MSEQIVSSMDVLLEGIQKAIEEDDSQNRKITETLAIALVDALSGMVNYGKPPQIALSEGINSAIESLEPPSQNSYLSKDNYYSIAILVKALSASFVTHVETSETKIVQLLPASNEAKKVN